MAGRFLSRLIGKIVFELPGELPDGLAAMADGVLLFGWQLGSGTALLRQDKQRVVPEAILPGGLVADASLDGSACFQQDVPVPGHRQVADEPGGAPLVGHVGERVEELGVVGSVDDGPRRVVLELVGGEPCAAHPGRAAQGVHLQARVIRQARQAGFRCIVQRLVPRVGSERVAGLLGLGDRLELLKAKD